MEYLLLAAFGVSAALYVTAYSDHRARCLAFLATAASVVTLADWIVYGWFSMYTYKTNLTGSAYGDNALGELLADILFVPGFSLLLVRYAPNLLGVAVGTAIVSAMELLFSWLGVFTHNGWSIWYTAAAFPIYFAGLIWYWRRLDEADLLHGWQTKQVRLALVFDAVALLSLLYRGLTLVETNIHVMPTYMGNQALGRFLWYALVTVPTGYWVLGAGGRTRWMRLGAALLGFVLLNVWLPAAGIQFFRRFWSGPLDALAQVAVILLAAWCQDQLRRLAQDEVGWRPPVMPRGR